MMYKIGICGIGVVGSAMKNSFQVKNQNIFAYDKYKNIGCFDDLLESDILFLTLPTLLNETTKKYDLDALHETCSKLKESNYTNPVVIKSTVLPGTCEEFANIYNLQIIHNPEFLTARTATEDFENQTHIVLGKTTICTNQNLSKAMVLYNELYPTADISVCFSTESEMMKIGLNCFYATKVQFFNEMYLSCQNLGIDYNYVKTMMLKNGWINPMHTTVPGPDGKLSYGGMCFPKDTNAFLTFMQEKILLVIY